MQFIEHLAALEIAHNAMLGAISAAWMNFVALFKRKKPAALVVCIRKAAEEVLIREVGEGKRWELSGTFFSLMIFFFHLTLIFRFLHRRHPARDFLCDRLGGIRRVEEFSIDVA